MKLNFSNLFSKIYPTFEKKYLFTLKLYDPKTKEKIVT